MHFLRTLVTVLLPIQNMIFAQEQVPEGENRVIDNNNNFVVNETGNFIVME